MKTVLIAEDEKIIRDMIDFQIKECSNNEICILWAQTIEEGIEIFWQNKEKLNVVVVDSCMPGDIPNTRPLLDEIVKSGFEGPVIATSGIEVYRQEMLEFGATCSVPKKEIYKRVIEMLQF